MSQLAGLLVVKFNGKCAGVPRPKVSSGVVGYGVLYDEEQQLSQCQRKYNSLQFLFIVFLISMWCVRSQKACMNSNFMFAAPVFHLAVEGCVVVNACIRRYPIISKTT